VRSALALLLGLAALWLPAAASGAPDVVLIQTDDQTVADLAAMPQTRALLEQGGASFEQSVVSLAQCCPSRATLLTGRYAHNHGVLSSSRPSGGYYRLDSAETLAVWLRRAGYHTALVGKYLNGYGTRDPFDVPTGWSEWHALLGSSTYRYYDYVMNHDGRLALHAGYQTDVLTTIAEGVVRRARAPLFLWVAYVAPHTGMPRDLLDPPGLPSPVVASRHHDALAETARLDDTLLIFTSDNGYMTGEHRLAASKGVPYEPSIRVPLLLRGPGVPAGVRRRQLVWNGDLAPTILEAAGAGAPWDTDGISLWPLLRGAEVRRDVLLEAPPRRGVPRYTGVRTDRYVYVEHRTGELELYDLRRDPGELENLAARPEAAGLRAMLAARLSRLRGCAGRSCYETPQPGAANTRHERLR
jgi:N-acetylglucosamine-6-sulfatase